jgi:hypothetical protein
MPATSARCRDTRTRCRTFQRAPQAYLLGGRTRDTRRGAAPGTACSGGWDPVQASGSRRLGRGRGISSRAAGDHERDDGRRDVELRLSRPEAPSRQRGQRRHDRQLMRDLSIEPHQPAIDPPVADPLLLEDLVDPGRESLRFFVGVRPPYHSIRYDDTWNTDVVEDLKVWTRTHVELELPQWDCVPGGRHGAGAPRERIAAVGGEAARRGAPPDRTPTRPAHPGAGGRCWLLYPLLRSPTRRSSASFNAVVIGPARPGAISTPATGALTGPPWTRSGS